MTDRDNESELGRRHGTWWQPCNPDIRFPGVLESTKAGRLVLEVFGALGPTSGSAIDLPNGQHRLFGLLENSQPVTLENCFATRRSGFLSGVRQSWHVSEAVIGTHLPPESAWEFYGAEFSIPGLTRWIAPQVVDRPIEFDEHNNCSRMGISVRPEEWPLWTTDSATRVRLARSISTRISGEYTASMESEIKLVVHGETLMNRRELHESYVAPVQILVSLATGKFTAAVGGAVQLDKASEKRRGHNTPWLWNPHKVEVDWLEDRYAFAYADVAVSSPDAFLNWRNRCKELEAVTSLYLATIRQLPFAEMAFLLVAQALEALHRLLFPDASLLPEEEWKGVEAAIEKELSNSDGHRAIRDKLRFLNEVGLRQRLNALLDTLGAVSEPICGGKRKNFISRIVTTRNYLTHWTEQNKVNAFQNEDIYFAGSRLLATLEILLLREIGIPLSSPACHAILERRVLWLPTAR